jgi:DNA-binding FadR family transcriptional regulator
MLESTLTADRPVHEAVASKIMAIINASNLRPGDRLPTERELSQRLEVSRATVRDAVKVLGAAGVVQAKQGSGLYFTGQPHPLVTAAVDLDVPLDAEHIIGLFEFRESVESQAARLAAERITLKQWRALELALEDCRLAVRAGDLVRFREHDQSFHRAIAEATGAPGSYFSATVTTLRRLLNYAVDFAIEATPGNLDTALQEHERIVQALRDGLPDAAEAAMRAHIHTARDGYQLELRRRLNVG